MRRALRAASTVSIAVGALLASIGVVVGVGGSPASALPVSVPVAFDFGLLPVGQSASDGAVLDIPFDSQVTVVELSTGGPPGAVAWTSRLCGSTGACRTLVDGDAGWTVAAGPWTLQVSATALVASPSPSTLNGRLVFFEDDEVLAAGGDGGSGLAATGASHVTMLAGLGTAAVVLGCALGLLARRRDRRAEASSARAVRGAP